jgi:SAM-dependent MidA family methyltransferase
VEVSPDLRERQQALIELELPHLASRFEWLDRMPDAHRGVIVANELLDALPVERFMIREDGVHQLRVADEAGEFVFVEEAAPEVLDSAVRAIEEELGAGLPANYVSEVSLSAPGWTSDMADTLEQGVALLFDYGVSRREYYAPDRGEGWLRCHFRHRAHSDPLILVGVQDLTAWVDFSAIAAAAGERGLEIQGWVSQAQFLLAGGLHDEMQQFANLSHGSQLDLSNQIKMLTLPGEMGENVKCIGLSRGDMPRMDAFGGADRTHTL